MKVFVPALCLSALLSLAPPNSRAETDPRAEIVLGMSTALSGPSRDLGNEMKTGVLLALARANRQGGIHGRPLRLVALDDGYEPDRTVPNMHRLIEQDNVLAIVGNVGTPTAIAAVPIANHDKVLFYGAFTGAGALRNSPPDRYVINFRASYAEETGAMIDALLDRAGLSPRDIAFFTQRDAYGDAGFAGGIAALKRHGLKDERDILHVRYERNTLAVENALASLLYAEHEPRAVILVGAYAQCARFIRLARKAGLDALFLNVSFVGSRSLEAELRGVPARVVVTQVVPPLGATDIPVVREFLLDAPEKDRGFGVLEGYIDGRILLHALDTMTGPPTREGLVDALLKLGDFDVGLRSPLRLLPGEHQASHRVWATLLTGNRFVPFSFDDMGRLLQTGRRR